MEVTEERFRALARSSPWRWQTLRFTLVRRPFPTPGFEAGLRAWVRRPDAVRVEDLDGNVVQIVREEPRKVGVLTSGGSWEPYLRDPRRSTPVMTGGGLVVERPRMLDYDAPMFHDYHWVAMLDPVELADAHDGGPGTRLRELEEVDHHGRVAWQAVVEPTDGYDPRCSCCPLLFSAASDALEAEASGADPSEARPPFRYADHHLVRLDVETGVCVYTEEAGGDRDGRWHQVRIEAVDQPMPDELFPVGKRPGWKLRRRR